MRPKHLAIELSKLSPHPQHNVKLEQYATEGDLAAFFALAIDQLESLNGKHVVDLGAGNGILGIGCGILGAKQVTLIEGDADVARVAAENGVAIMTKFDVKIETLTGMIGIDVIEPSTDCDIVVMNPPWGFQNQKADRPLLSYGFSLEPASLFVLHSAQATHIEKIGKSFGYDCELVFASNFRLPPNYHHHSRKMHEIEVKCWRLYKPGNAKLTEVDD